ncbi:MAG: VOC family protein [Lysobacterales bacterium]
MEDIFVPKSRPAEALVGPLHTVTYVTAEMDRVDELLAQGYGLTICDDAAPSLGDAADYLGVDPAVLLQIRGYGKAGDGANVQLRVINVTPERPQVRTSHSGHDLGGVTVSFPMNDLYAHEEVMKRIGVESTIGVKEMTFTSPDGQSYVSAEILYKAPENILLLGVKRPDMFIPVGPIDQGTGLGGAAYSARNVADADRMAEMLETVMGYEIRRDATFDIGERSGLLLPEGAKERFVQAFAPGANTGYLVFMDHFDLNRPTAAAQTASSRGVVMWTFTTTNIEEVHRRATAFGLTIVRPPGPSVSPCIKADQSMLVEDSEGFQLEFVQ